MAKMVLNTINNQVCILQKPVFCCFEYSSTEVYLCKRCWYESIVKDIDMHCKLVYRSLFRDQSFRIPFGKNWFSRFKSEIPWLSEFVQCEEDSTRARSLSVVLKLVEWSFIRVQDLVVWQENLLSF